MAWYHIVFGVALIVLAVLIVVFILAQEGNEQGLSAISGGSSESYQSPDLIISHGKPCVKNKNAAMNRCVKRCVILLCSVFNISNKVAYGLDLLKCFI